MQSKHKVILLFPNFRRLERFFITPHQRSLSLGYIAAALVKNKVPLLIIDAAAENLMDDEINRRIEKFDPDIIGITANISLSYMALYHAVLIRKRFPDKKIIMGGPWAVSKYEHILKKNFADIVVLGEGEDTMVKLAQCDINDIDQLKQIEGISFMAPEGLITIKRRSYIQNLDELEHPLWDLFPKKGYTESARAVPMFPLITSRGCPYNCMNCTKIIHGYKMRYRSIENILQELDYLHQIGAKEIAIEDDMFNLDLVRMKKIFRAIIRKKYGFKIQLSNGLRADNIDQEIAHLMYAAGVYRLALGIESGSPKVIKFLKKGLDLRKVTKTVEILHNAHIKVVGYFIMGLPIENLKSMLYSIKFGNSVQLDMVVLMDLVVFPGTELYNYIVKNTNYKVKSALTNVVLNYQYAPFQFTTAEITPKVLKKVKAYYLIYSYLNPLRLLRIFSSIRPKEIFYLLKTHVKIVFKRYFSPTMIQDHRKIKSPIDKSPTQANQTYYHILDKNTEYSFAKTN